MSSDAVREVERAKKDTQKALLEAIQAELAKGHAPKGVLLLAEAFAYTVAPDNAHGSATD